MERFNGRDIKGKDSDSTTAKKLERKDGENFVCQQNDWSKLYPYTNLCKIIYIYTLLQRDGQLQ